MGDMQQRIDEIIDFWFGELNDDGQVSEDKRVRWWKKDPAFDDLIAQRFGSLVAVAATGELEDWRLSARGQLAAVLLIDQFRRNIFRDRPEAWSEDAAAQEFSRELIDSGRINDLPEQHRYFALLPLMHAESITSQGECVARFDALASVTPLGGLKSTFEEAAKYARMHRDIIRRFGRFPHRNAVIGRVSTAEETEFLKTTGSSF